MTQRFLNQFYRITGPLQTKALEYSRDKIEFAISQVSNASNHDSDPFQTFPPKNFTFNDVHFRIGERSVGSDESKKANVAELDTKTKFFMDRIYESLPDAETLDRGLEEKNMQDIKSLSYRFYEDLGKVTDIKTAQKMHHKITQFTSPSILEQPLARILDFFHEMLDSLKEIIGKVAILMDDLIIIANRIVLALTELPLRIPFISKFWKQIVAPGVGELNVLHFYNFVGSCQATWAYKLYRGGKSPFTETDIQVIETVRDPQLVLYTWNLHPFTASNDPSVLKQRVQIFDWIPRTSSATLVTVTKSIFMAIPPRMQVAKSSFKIARFVSTYLINAWFFPISQVRDSILESI